MLSKSEILLIAKQAMKEFNVKCEIKFLPYEKFFKVAKKSPLIKQVLDEGFTFGELKIPALIYHEEKDHIYLNQKIISSITKKFDKKAQKQFVKSVIYHELFHIMYEHQVKQKNFIQCLKSEERVCNSFKKKYPILHKVGYDLHRKSSEI